MDKPEEDASCRDRHFARNKAVLDAYIRGCDEVSDIITEDDEMMESIVVASNISTTDQHSTSGIYMFGGRSALKICIDALFRANAKLPLRILDFPSGHGRALRYLRAAFPEATIYAGDINESGLKFCRDQFGADVVLSHIDLSEVVLPEKIDLIWCGSLVTHLSERRALQLLDMFFQNLAPDGICLFTTHGRMYARYISGVTPIIDAASWDTIIRDYYRTGYGYQDYQDPQLSRIEIGISMTSPDWIFEQIHMRDDLSVLFFSEKAWHGQHDVTAVQKRDLSTWYDPRFL